LVLSIFPVAFGIWLLPWAAVGAVDGVTVNLGTVKTDVKKLRQASEIAQALDNYQYTMCLLSKDLDKKTRDFKDFLKMRAAVITLITTFQITLAASSEDGGKFEGELKELISKMKALANEVQPARAKATRTSPPRYVIESYQPPPVPEHGADFIKPESIDIDRIAGGVGGRCKWYSEKEENGGEKRPINDAFRYAGIEPKQVNALLKEISLQC
jgi:uncharacterized coiled-coil protein SlyX